MCILLRGGVCLALLALTGGRLAAQVASWPDYRGEDFSGYVERADVPLEWGEGRNIRWKCMVPGTGWSSPVIEAGVAWLTTSTDTGQELHVLAFDVESGEQLLDRVVFANATPEKKNKLNSFASPSPVIAGDHVYVHFGSYGTACVDAKSREILWERRDINCDHMEGPGSSPVLYQDLLIFNVDGGDVQYVIALDRKTGQTKWRTDRSVDFGKLPADLRKAYSTPITVRVGGRWQLLSTGAQASYAYDPNTGEELWRLRFRGFSMAPRPLFGDGKVYLTTGFARAQMLAVDVSGEGDVTKDNLVWSYRRNVPKMSSPVLVGRRIYMVDDSGFATCLNCETGEAVWRERIGGEHCASPLCVGDRIYFFDRSGQTVVLARSDEFKRLATNQLDDGFMSSPAVIGDDLILRTRSHLYRIGTPNGN
jgi:outer membrane protein assembly factor BamB